MWFAAALLTTHAHAAETYGDALYYVGDLHAHTGYSGDGASSDLGGCTSSCGAFADVFDDARANGLDFVAIADHLNGFREVASADWDVLHAAVLAANDPEGGFVTLPAGELWFYDGTSYTNPIGHKTLLLFGDDATLAPLTLSDVRPGTSPHVTACEDIWTWADTLSGTHGDLLLVPHHPATSAPMWTDWACHSDTYTPAVEIYSRHGNSLEAESGYDVPGAGVVTSGYASAAVDPDEYGLRLGFVGGTDAHDTRPGETCATDTEHPTHLYGGALTILVLDAAETFDRPAIHDAIVEHRTWTTTGPLLTPVLGWTASGEALGGLGEDLSVYEDEDLTVTVELPGDQAVYVDEVLAVGPTGSWTLEDDGSGVYTGTIPAEDVPGYLYVRVALDGDAWYGAGVCADGGSDATEYTWSSPSYIDRVDDDLDDDGVTARAGDCDDTDPAVAPGAAETWYDGVDADCDGASDWDQDGDGASILEGDCDDTDPAVNPDARDVVDGVDDDCDGVDGTESDPADAEPDSVGCDPDALPGDTGSLPCDADLDTGGADPGEDDTGALLAFDPADADTGVSDRREADPYAAEDEPASTDADPEAAEAGEADDTAADDRPRGRRHRPPLRPDGSRPPRPPLNPDGSRPALPAR